MKILKVLSQFRRDMRVQFECENCGATYMGQAYDDTNYHQNVLPNMACKECGETAGDDYRALAPKHSDDQVI